MIILNNLKSNYAYQIRPGFLRPGKITLSRREVLGDFLPSRVVGMHVPVAIVFAVSGKGKKAQGPAREVFTCPSHSLV